MEMKALPGKVLVKNLESGERKTAGGIILRNDDKKSEGIRPRWAEVYSIGTGVTDVEVGDWILVKHGRWSRGVKYNNEVLHLVEYPTSVMIKTKDNPLISGTTTFGDLQTPTSVVPKKV